MTLDAFARTDTPTAPPDRPADPGAAAAFPFLLPPAYARKIERAGEPEALLRQILPAPEELRDVPGFSADPLDESPAERLGVIEKYPGRLLLMVTPACSGHCRFCFRRHLLDAGPPRADQVAAFRRRMARSDDITEVILSGGDPLVLSDRRLADWFDEIARYSFVRRIRIHTREPVFSPERITPELAALLASAPRPVIVAVHVNHADELDDETAAALARLREAGVLLLTQTVLLRGVNDSFARLAALFERAVDCGLTPYYLHQLDPVAGAAHFAVTPERGQALVRRLRRSLPGYLVPRYVAEVPGEPGKSPLA
ncbi:MAG: KamA family radical SAM protein [Xanthomonadales bacterium]